MTTKTKRFKKKINKLNINIPIDYGKKKTTGKRPETNYEQFKNQLGEEPYHLSHACGPKTSLSSHYNLHMVPRELMDCSFKSNESLEEPFRKLHRLNTCIHERKKSGKEWKSRGLVDVDKQKRHEEPIRQFKVARRIGRTRSTRVF